MLAIFFTTPLLAEEPKTSPNPQDPNISEKSESYDKSEDRFLPGEEVVTSTGQKMKVWSTKGQLHVSPPPKPFEDPSAQRLPSGIIIDTRNQNLPQTQPVVPDTTKPTTNTTDSFRVK